MISKSILDQLTKLAYPGITLYFMELKHTMDKNTVSDINGELSKALASKNIIDIGNIVVSIYKNSKYNGEIVNNKGKLSLVSNGKVYDISIINNGSVLKISDTLNRKTTIIEYKASPQKTTSISLQDQLLKQLEIKKMTDKEVIDFIKKISVS